MFKCIVHVCIPLWFQELLDQYCSWLHIAYYMFRWVSSDESHYSEPAVIRNIAVSSLWRSPIFKLKRKETKQKVLRWLKPLKNSQVIMYYWLMAAIRGFSRTDWANEIEPVWMSHDWWRLMTSVPFVALGLCSAINFTVTTNAETVKKIFTNREHPPSFQRYFQQVGFKKFACQSRISKLTVISLYSAFFSPY